MDWTGGTRRRFTGSKNGNTALKKQKAHFAKARAASNHGPAANHRNPLSSSEFKLPNPMGMLDVQRHRRSRRDAHDRRANPRITSSRDSARKSTASSMHNERIAQQEDVQPGGLAANSHIRNDGELMLLASRRKLLARSDWLALDLTRPLRLNFPANSKDDHVGRRKKIKRASAEASKPAQQRLLTPLFEERLHANDYMMSGALPQPSDGKIEIKVGTDAFDSQTCPSRRSHMSMEASVGSQSTSLNRLSEEPMLLGADGDDFDANLVEVQPSHVRREEPVEPSDYGYRTPLYTAGWSTRATHGHSPAYTNQTGLQQHAVFPPEERFIATAEQDQRTDIPGDDVLSEAFLGEQDGAEIKPAGGAGSSDDMLELSHFDTFSSADQTEPDSEAEDAWKRLMGIATQVASSASIKALNSMSGHITTSGTPCEIDPDGAEISDTAMSSPKSKPPHPGERDPEDGSIALIESRRAAKLLVATAEPSRLNEEPEDENGESLWRQFIIGSQDSESEDELHSAWQRKRKRSSSSSERSQHLLLSGLGTFDKATQGGTVALSSPSFVPIAKPGESRRVHSSESIEGVVELTPDSQGPQNIHARSTERKTTRPLKKTGVHRPL